MSKYVLQLKELQSLSRMIHTSLDPIAIEKALSHVLNFYGLVNYQLKYDRPFLRGVLCDSAEGYPNISRVGYPPPEVSKNGRLNEAGKPLLYVSPNQFTILEEIGAKINDYVHIIAYSLKTDTRLRTGIVGEINQIHRWGRSSISEELTSNIGKFLNEMDFEVGKSFVFTDALISSILRDRQASENNYLRSRILSRLLFASVDGLEAMAYPSIAHEGSMNFALTPQAADRKLAIHSTIVIQVTQKYDYGFYDFKIVRRAHGHDANGVIHWK